MGVCVWSEDDFGEYWDTGCGHAFTINDGTPKDNEFAYCCHCGGKLEQETAAERDAKPVDDEDE